MALSARPAVWRRKLITFSRVAAGEVVGTLIVCQSSGLVPTPTTNLVPPASMQPKRLTLSSRRASLPQREQSRKGDCQRCFPEPPASLLRALPTFFLGAFFRGLFEFFL